MKQQSRETFESRHVHLILSLHSYWLSIWFHNDPCVCINKGNTGNIYFMRYRLLSNADFFNMYICEKKKGITLHV